MAHAAKLKQAINAENILIAPGGYDALSAALIENSEFKAIYLSGASIAYTRFGRPDIGLVSMSEVAETISVIRERTELPIIVDAGTGFGNAINVQRTVKLFEQMGASAIQLADQKLPRQCGHLNEKSLVSKEEMVGKINAAIDARSNQDTLIIVRTDAIAIEGFDKALERAEAYCNAGADCLLIEAPENLQQIARLNEHFKNKIPLLANMIEEGSTPISSAKDLEEMGYSLVIFPDAMVKAQTFMAKEFLTSLKTHGNTSHYQDRMLDLTTLDELLGTPEILANSQQYQEQ